MAFTAQADADVVTKVLLQSSLPAALREMLTSGLPIAIRSQGRHELQEEFVKLAHSSVVDLKSEAAERNASFQPAVAAAHEGIVAAKAAVEAAKQVEQAAAAEVQGKHGELAKRRAALDKTKQERQAAEAVRDRVLEDWNSVEARKAAVSNVLDGPLRMLREGGWEDEDVRDAAVDAVAGMLSSLCADRVLAAAAPTALALRPEGRHEFDELAAGSVAELLQEQISDLEQQLKAQASPRRDAEAVALGLMALAVREGEEEAAALADLARAQGSEEAAKLERQVAEAAFARAQEALSVQLAEQVCEEDRARQLDVALEAAERLVTFEYQAEAHEASEPPADAKMAEEDVEMPVAAAPKGEESAVKAMQSKMMSPARSPGNRLGVATPMAA